MLSIYQGKPEKTAMKFKKNILTINNLQKRHYSYKIHRDSELDFKKGCHAEALEICAHRPYPLLSKGERPMRL
jgi:hypothetical protein